MFVFDFASCPLASCPPPVCFGTTHSRVLDVVCCVCCFGGGRGAASCLKSFEQHFLLNL